MKFQRFLTSTCLLTCLVLANPLANSTVRNEVEPPEPEPSKLPPKPIAEYHANEFWDTMWEETPCKEIYLIFARGYEEIDEGNLGKQVGPKLCKSLKNAYGHDKVGCQGLDKYTPQPVASLKPPYMGSKKDMDEMRKLLQACVDLCPNAMIVVAGHRQGTSPIAHALARIDMNAKRKILLNVAFQSFLGKAFISLKYPAHRQINWCFGGEKTCNARQRLMNSPLGNVLEPGRRDVMGGGERDWKGIGHGSVDDQKKVIDHAIKYSVNAMSYWIELAKTEGEVVEGRPYCWKAPEASLRNGYNLDKFKEWMASKGTPLVKVGEDGYSGRE